MNTNKRLNFFVFFIFIGLIISPVNAITLFEKFTKQIECDDEPALELKNTNGRVEIISWDKNVVQIEANIKVKAKESVAQKMLDRIKIEIEHNDNGNEIFVETIVPKGFQGSGGFFSWLFGDRDFSYSVEYEVSVPRNSNLDINTTNGRIFVEEVSGNIKMNSTNGKLTVKNVSGFLHCETTNGKIHAEIEKIVSDEELIFKTSNGSIKLYLPEEYGGYANLKTTNGRIDSDFDLYSDYKKSRKHKNYFRGEFGNGDVSITCKTTNGSIYLLKNL